MPRYEQQAIQAQIERSSPAKREQMQKDAEAILTTASSLASVGRLTPMYETEAMSAIEVLTRIDALKEGKGPLFRGRRRIQYVHKYLMQRV